MISLLCFSLPPQPPSVALIQLIFNYARRLGYEELVVGYEVPPLEIPDILSCRIASSHRKRKGRSRSKSRGESSVKLHIFDSYILSLIGAG